jgi:3-dehydroquinate synthetase
MPTIEPEPPEEVREAILAALDGGVAEDIEGWSAAALQEGVEDADLDP